MTESIERTLEFLSQSWDPSVKDKQDRLHIIDRLCALLQETFKPPSSLVARPYGSFIVSGCQGEW